MHIYVLNRYKAILIVKRINILHITNECKKAVSINLNSFAVK